MRERFEQLGWRVAKQPFRDAVHHARDPEGRDCSVDLDRGVFWRWGEPEVWQTPRSPPAVVDPALSALDRLREVISIRWPHVVIDFAGPLPSQDYGLVCTHERSGCQFLARSLDDVVRYCGDPAPQVQATLF